MRGNLCASAIGVVTVIERCIWVMGAAGYHSIRTSEQPASSGACTFVDLFHRVSLIQVRLVRDRPASLCRAAE